MSSLLRIFRIHGGQDLSYSSMIPDVHAISLQTSEQGCRDIRGVIRDRKHTVSPLHFDRASVFFKEILDHIMVKPIDSTVQKFVVAGNIGKKIFRRAVVGQITAAFSGDIDLFSCFLVLFQHCDPVSIF